MTSDVAGTTPTVAEGHHVPMRIEESFSISRPREEVFAFMVDPKNLAKWQSIKTSARPLSEGPPRLGYQIREGNKMGPRKWEQTVEFTEFEPGRLLKVTAIDGPPSWGRWTLQPDGARTRVNFESEVQVPRLLAPILKLLASRQFRGYHRNLRRELEPA